MKLEVRRFEYGKDYTISKLYIDGVYQCFVLEDIVREKSVKIAKETAIPCGTYDLTIDWSPKYKRAMPHILNVPGFEGIRIHSGNTDEDTEGCLLVGEGWPGGNMITSSRLAYNKLFPKLQEQIGKKEKTTITITDIK